MSKPATLTRTEGLAVVTEWQAEALLASQGYAKVPCKACHGLGSFAIVNGHGWKKFACESCGGAKWKWQKCG
jgi:DnaJ-class molecular chaperone